MGYRDFVPLELADQRIALRVGLISDTHMPERLAALPPAIFSIFRDVDLILHAGDVGKLGVLDRLSAVAPVVAVHGNDDTEEAQRELPYQQLVAVAGQRLLLTHAHEPDRAKELASRQSNDWEPKLERRATMGRRAGASVVVFGHTHVAMARRYANILLVNPGAIASGSYVTRQRRRTVALLVFPEQGAPSVVHVDLADPSVRYAPSVDWHAGFQAALDDVSETILSPEVERAWPRLRAELQSESTDASRFPFLRLAHRCWAGELACITRDDLLAELDATSGLAPDRRARFRAILVGTDADTTPCTETCGTP